MATEMVRVTTMSNEDRELVNILTTDERLAALRAAGRRKVAEMHARYTERDAEDTYFRGMELDDILAEAGASLTDDEHTYVYISNESGKWTSILKPDLESDPVDDLGRGGFYIRSCRGWRGTTS